MKLILTVVRDDDASNVIDALTEHGFYVTRLSSTGGFLRMGNSVLLMGIEDDDLDRVQEVIRAHAEVRVQPPSSHVEQETRISRAVAFVLELQQMVKL
mgnify:CR=1 FL=1